MINPAAAARVPRSPRETDVAREPAKIRASAAQTLGLTRRNVQPKRKAMRRPYVSRRNTYCPPACGNNVASSAIDSAPHRQTTPPSTQTARIAGAEPASAAIELGTRKIPLPIISPMTTAVALEAPRRRGSCVWRSVARSWCVMDVAMVRRLTDAIFVFVLLFFPEGLRLAEACSCYDNPPCSAVWKDDAVFVGTVVEHAQEPLGGTISWTVHKIAVNRRLHGSVEPLVTLVPDVSRPTDAEIDASRLQGASLSKMSTCDYDFEVGRQYVFYARKT